ncbi:hypothetical protein CGLO_16092 [Colletotrichum gloeosporioides Cg-14]|uniref:DUF7708 domain-containing protein n=1 Tax=Colletotrichum gloeosporioides (strain Cg-14) TaxID=1237896 RepID=T0L0K8_COLGC|nr:hypothetical protein CGLO_16092 [Colletotrichum gloeosporioides Cg-14]
MALPTHINDGGRSLEEQYVEHAVYGKVLHPPNQSVEEFVSKADGKIHPAFDASGFAIERGRLMISVPDLDRSPQEGHQELNLQDLYRECFDAYDVFIKTYYRVFKANSDEDIDAAAELQPPSKIQSFQEVETVIATICEHLEAKQRAKIKLRERNPCTRRLHDALAAFKRQSKNVELFLSVLPSGSEYGSLICGALSVVFSAIDKHEILKENVCQAVEEIQEAMGNQEYVAQIYREDPEIHRRMANVCASIFKILGYILRFVGQTKLKKLTQAIMRPATHGDELSGLLSQLRMMNKYLVDRAEKLLHRALRNSQEASSKTAALQLEHNLRVSDVLGQVHNAIATFQNDLKAWAVNGQGKPYIQQIPANFDIDKLLEDMNYQGSLVDDDCSNITCGYHLSRREEEVIQQLTIDIRVEAFVKVKRSAALLILGGNNCRDLPLSAISYFNANIFGSLSSLARQERSICVLAYFCGQHKDDGEPFSSPMDLITTLILQLLSQTGNNIDPETLLQFRIMDTLYEQKLASVCKLLAKLLDALSKDTLVFCLIDGVSFFESPKARKEDMIVVVGFLLRHARKRQRKARGAKLKVLFAAPSSCHELHEMFEEYETFTVDGGLRDRDALR